MNAVCRACNTAFVIHPDEEAFVDKMQFTYGSTVIHPVLSPYCPDCRSQIRTSHRNERFLYKTRSACSGKDIVALYAETPLENAPSKVFAQEEWKSDIWDPLSFGRDFDFSRPFFEQFAELQRDVPRMALISLGNENSGYTTGTGYCKNCYLINSSENCEDCYYGKLMQKSMRSMDCHYLYDSQYCYECFSVYNCYYCQFVSFSQNCESCLFSSNLKGCKNCCLCTNLNHKEYHFMNEPLSKEEYNKRLAEFMGDYERTEAMKKLYGDVMRTMIRKYANIVNSDDSTGDYIENSKNCHDCYDVTDSQDCRHVYVGVNVKDNYHCSNMYIKPELCYETLGTIEVYNTAYCLFVFHCQNFLYSEYSFSSKDCFGCSGMTHKQYCIMNKQYTKDEYETLVPKIVEHMKKTSEWGLYFPPQLSPFGYNESVASEYFPLSKEDAIAKGFRWRDPDDREHRSQTAQLPNKIVEADETLTQEIFSCSDCNRNYRIIPQELTFYKDFVIALPRRCPDCRYTQRMKLRNPRKLWERSCSNCNKPVHTTYSPDGPETVYCERCYLEAVY